MIISFIIGPGYDGQHDGRTHDGYLTECLNESVIKNDMSTIEHD